MSAGWQFWIDRGGTFTDVIGVAPDGQLHVRKVLSQTNGADDPGMQGAHAILWTTPSAATSAVKVGTTVTWTNGELWHAVWENDESELRHIDPTTGKVLERLEMPAGTGISGLECDGDGRFFCGGGRSGKVRAVRRP